MANLLQRISSALRMPRATPFREMGASGTPVYGGYIYTPEKSSKWVGQQRYTTSAEIAANVSIVAAGIHYFVNLVARPKWSVNPADDNSAEAIELAEFMDSVLRSMETPWPRIVRRAVMYKFHGFSIQEWTAMRRPDGYIGMRDVEPRSQHTIEQWDITPDGAVNGVFQRSPQTGELLPLPRSKIIYMVDDTLTDSPEGMGIFRHLAEPYNRLNRYLKLESGAFERDLRGIPIGRIPYTLYNSLVKNGTMTREEADAMVKSMEDFVKVAVKEKDTGLTIDSTPYQSVGADGPKIAAVMQWGLELLQGSANGLQELAAAINRLQLEMARLIGVEGLMMGTEGSGNRALAQDKSRNLYLIANAVLANEMAAFDKDLVTPIWTLNGFPDELRPTLGVEDVSFKDVVEVTSALKDMATAGAVLAPDDPVVGDVRDLLGVSQPEPMSAEMVGVLPEEEEGEEEEVEEETPIRRSTPRRRLRRTTAIPA